MGWNGVLFSFLSLATLGESADRLGRFWPVSIIAGTSSLYSWAVTSAAVLVVVALILSMYLIFEHLAAYNQPEVRLDFKFLKHVSNLLTDMFPWLL